MVKFGLFKRCIKSTTNSLTPNVRHLPVRPEAVRLAPVPLRPSPPSLPQEEVRRGQSQAEAAPGAHDRPAGQGDCRHSQEDAHAVKQEEKMMTRTASILLYIHVLYRYTCCYLCWYSIHNSIRQLVFRLLHSRLIATDVRERPQTFPTHANTTKKLPRHVC